MIIRGAEIKDAERILEIYAHYVENTAITFECEVPTIGEFTNRIVQKKENTPILFWKMTE